MKKGANLRWKARVRDPEIPEHYGRMWRQDVVNREHVHAVTDMPLHRVFGSGFEFLDANRDEDNWLLHIEPFDPHEPFHSDPAFRALYPEDYDGPVFDWPDYKRVTEPPEAVQHRSSSTTRAIRNWTGRSGAR